MKNEKQKNIPKNCSETGAASWKLRFQKLLCVALGLVILAVGIHFGTSVQVTALAIPDHYGTGYGIENLENLSNEQSFEGIRCKDKTNKVYALSFGENENGLVTLARISQNHSLYGYTFEIALGGSVILDVKYENGLPISNGSFFG
ncbi:MAG: hypothetical protein PUC29_04445, partial [Clostridia bacterium]|nr:hypothetical protein [Clostridia bacterium]